MSTPTPTSGQDVLPGEEVVPWGTWSFYDPTNGVFMDGGFSGPRTALELNTPEGFVAYSGQVDKMSQRIDPATGELVDWIPPPPEPRILYQWDPTARRWVLTELARAAKERAERALAEIHRLEAMEQPRAVRETLLGIPGGIERLVVIQEKIEKLREDLPTPL